MWSLIHPFSEDLNEGRDVADDADTDIQHRIDHGKECRYVSVREWGIWSLAVLCPQELRLLGSRSTAGFTSTSPFMILNICLMFSWTVDSQGGAVQPMQRHHR